MSEQDSNPRVWEFPVEPPAGTVVSNADGKRFRHVDYTTWFEVASDGSEVEYGLPWMDVLMQLSGGRVVEVPATPAEESAVRLELLARHLRANRELHPVFVHGEGLQLAASRHEAGVLLAAWARSMDSPSLRFQTFKELAHVHVTGQLIAGNEEDVWSSVPGFREFLVEQGVPADPDSNFADAPIELLRDFAAIRDQSAVAGAQ